jgi:hypothetical protein
MPLCFLTAFLCAASTLLPCVSPQFVIVYILCFSTPVFFSFIILPSYPVFLSPCLPLFLFLSILSSRWFLLKFGLIFIGKDHAQCGAKVDTRIDSSEWIGAYVCAISSRARRRWISAGEAGCIAGTTDPWTPHQELMQSFQPSENSPSTEPK